MSGGSQRLTGGRAVFVGGWLRLTRVVLGHPDLLTEEYVRTYGVRKFLRWVAAIVRVIGRLERRYGDVEAQMLLGFAALWTGCRWCGVGHILSANLMLFEREAVLSPVDELSIPLLQDMRDAEVLAELERRLREPRWEVVRAAMRRQYELHAGEVASVDEDDARLEEANHMWEWVTECSIVAMDRDPLTITPRSTIGRDHALLRRYRRARARAREAEPPPR